MLSVRRNGSVKKFHLWVADSPGHLHCNKLQANDLVNRNRTGGKNYRKGGFCGEIIDKR